MITYNLSYFQPFRKTFLKYSKGQIFHQTFIILIKYQLCSICIKTLYWFRTHSYFLIKFSSDPFPVPSPPPNLSPPLPCAPWWDGPRVSVSCRWSGWTWGSCRPRPSLSRAGRKWLTARACLRPKIDHTCKMRGIKSKSKVLLKLEILINSVFPYISIFFIFQFLYV